jgi:esterase/lipase superfamily enzyme
MSPNRRTFLRGSAGVLTAGAIATGAGAASGSTELAGVVSTRGHFESDDSQDGIGLVPGISKREFTTTGTIPGFEESADDVLVFVHGLNTDEKAATDIFETATTALLAADADVPVLGFTYDSDVGSDSGDNAEIARRNGPKLGSFFQQLRDQTPDTRLHLVGYSLGGLVAMSTLEFLEAEDTGVTIDTVHMLAGAPEVDAVTTEGAYGPGIQEAAGQVYNFHRPIDIVLAYFNFLETPAVGRVGVDLERAPANVTNIDVTTDVFNHFTYPKKTGGCLDQVATRL